MWVWPSFVSFPTQTGGQNILFLGAGYLPLMPLIPHLIVSVCVCVCVCAHLLSHVWLFVILWTIARQGPLLYSIGYPLLVIHYWLSILNIAHWLLLKVLGKSLHLSWPHFHFFFFLPVKWDKNTHLKAHLWGWLAHIGIWKIPVIK